MTILNFTLVWTAEEGSRTLVHAVSAGKESHGVFLSGGKVENQALASWVTSPGGVETQKVVWRFLGERLEGICPGVMAAI